MILCLNLSALAQNTQQHCNLTATVVNSATNAGIPRALVTYSGAAQGFRFTDAGGNIQVANVPCGFYNLAVSKPGFVSGQEDLGQAALRMNPAFRELMEQAEDTRAAPQPANQPVNLTPDSAATRVPLLPVASIAGTVLDENGEPLAGVVAQAISVKSPVSGAEYAAVKTAHTDDRGYYELLGLKPGNYLVRLAGEASSTQFFQGSAPNPNNDHRGMQPVYYPNSASIAAAARLTLAPGGQATADFRQATEAAFDVDGHLSGFVPQAWTRLRLYRDGDRIPSGRAFVNLTTGQFRLTDVPRGSYTLRVEQYQAAEHPWLAAEQPIVVSDAPVRNLVIPLSPAVDIPVTISFEDGAKEEGALQVMLQPQHSPENLRHTFINKGLDLPHPDPAKPEPAIRPDTLTDVVPDKYRLTAQWNGNTGYVASATIGDRDVLHGEFAIGGRGAGELHIVVRGDSATLSGRVTFQGKPAAGAQIYLIPTGDSDGFKPGFADQQGHYTVLNVPPGEYRVRAWTGAPTAKDLTASGGDTLTMEASQQRTLDITAVEPEQK